MTTTTIPHLLITPRDHGDELKAIDPFGTAVHVGFVHNNPKAKRFYRLSAPMVAFCKNPSSIIDNMNKYNQLMFILYNKFKERVFSHRQASNALQWEVDRMKKMISATKKKSICLKARRSTLRLYYKLKKDWSSGDLADDAIYEGAIIERAERPTKPSKKAKTN